MLLILLAFTDRLRSDRTLPRRHDLTWLTWAAVAAYLLHQFEEHGIDALGRAYGFRAGMCGVLGFPDAATCPIPEAFITAVNVPLVWIVGPIAALLAARWPLIALGFFSVPLINAPAHILPILAGQGYNSGVVTAIAVFLPLSLWALAVAVRRYGVGWRGVVVTVACGLLLHAILFGSARAFAAGLIGADTLIAIQVINAALPLAFMAIAGRIVRF